MSDGRGKIVGSRLRWLGARWSELAVVCLLVWLNYRHTFEFAVAIFSLVLILFCVSLHQQVYGFIEPEGLRYRRYLRWNFSRWDDIEDISQNIAAGAILVDLRNENRFNHRLRFIPDPFLFGRSTSTGANYDELRRAWLTGR